MKVLVIGGTEFVGRHLVERGLRLGHEITLFHRGQHGTELFPEAKRVFGDRDGGLSALGDETWDAVIDTCGYVPRLVRQSCEFLKDKVGRYLFISTISVLGDFSQVGLTEDSELATLKDPNVEVVNNETYGGLKVLCEEEVNRVFGERALNVRPGMIVGPYDKTDRFTYWFRRAAKGGAMLSMAERDEPAQFIDGRDLASFCFHLLEIQASGAYFATGPQFAMTWGDIFDEAAIQGGSEYEIIRPPLDWMKEQGVEIGPSFPSQFPSELNRQGIYQIDVQKGLDEGLRFLPLAETIKDTLEWRDSVADPLKVGFEAERAQELSELYRRSEF